MNFDLSEAAGNRKSTSLVHQKMKPEVCLDMLAFLAMVERNGKSHNLDSRNLGCCHADVGLRLFFVLSNFQNDRFDPLD